MLDGTADSVTQLVGVDPIAYEFVNLTLVGLCIASLTIFARYLATEFCARRLTFRTLVTSRGLLRHRMAVAIAFASAGEAGLRGWTWWSKFAGRHGFDSAWMAGSFWHFAPLVAAAIQIAGLLCFIRVFSPDEWGARAWIFSAGVILFVAVVATLAL
jgi:hypothetical protein